MSERKETPIQQFNIIRGVLREMLIHAYEQGEGDGRAAGDHPRRAFKSADAYARYVLANMDLGGGL